MESNLITYYFCWPFNQMFENVILILSSLLSL